MIQLRNLFLMFFLSKRNSRNEFHDKRQFNCDIWTSCNYNNMINNK